MYDQENTSIDKDAGGNCEVFVCDVRCPGYSKSHCRDTRKTESHGHCLRDKRLLRHFEEEDSMDDPQTKIHGQQYGGCRDIYR